MKVDIGSFHEELKEIVGYQITNAVAILYTMACTAIPEGVNEDLFFSDLSLFMKQVLDAVKKDIHYKIVDGEGSFLLTGDIKHLIERSLHEAEMLKMEKTAAKKFEQEQGVA